MEGDFLKKIKYQYLISVLFLLTYVFKSFTDAIYVSKKISTPLISVKYIFAFATIFTAIIVLCINKRKLIFIKPLAYVSFVSLFFMLISLIMMCFNQHFTQDCFVYVYKLMIGIVLAFCVINTVDFEFLYKIFVVIFFATFFSYLLEIGVDKFTISNIQSISYSKSYSPFESHFFSGPSVSLCLFFCLCKKSKIMPILGLLFVICTFKRLSLIFAFIFFILPFFVKENKLVDKKITYILAGTFVVLTFSYYYLLQPQNQFILEKLLNIKSINSFTMGRSNFMVYLSSMDYPNFGIGSVTAALEKPLEMDLVQILIETTPIGLIIFCFSYWKISGNKIYSIIILLFLFINMLTSHSLANGLNWAIYFLTIFTINNSSSTVLRNLKKLK